MQGRSDERFDTCTLSEQQQLIFNLVQGGHNVYFGGIAGCGKTYVAKHILDVLNWKNKKFACTCTTGIACTLYGEIPACTIHSFAGIGHCRGTKEQLLRNVLANQECSNRWRLTEILFIDEISMLSKRTFETINYIAQNIRNSNYMFGGLQVVAFGDFLQLPPVPSAIDEGKYAFQSELWQFVFPHQVILEDSFRAKDDSELVNLLKDISVGRCSDQSLNLIKTLSRPLDPAELQLDFIPKVFPLNEDVDYSNMCTLDSLPGQEVVFQAYDIGEKKLLDRELVANEKLILKVGAKVMFIYNINDRIKNGVQGTVASFLNGLPVVTTSDGTESVVVERVTWSVYDRIETHKLVGTRTQIPLKLGWAMTVHKAQGQTLEAVEVHCGREFAPGHLYVAISRVKSKDHLRVIGFNKNRLIPAAPEVLNFLDNVTNATTQPGKKCCQLTSLSSSTEEEFDFDDEPLCEENFDEIDAIVQTFLDSNVAQAEEDVTDLDSLLSQMSESEEFHKIPVDFDYGTFLRTLSIKEEELHAQELVANVNAIFTSLCEPELLQSTKVFVSVQWNRIFSLIRQQVSENPTRKVKRKDFTCHFSDLHSLLVSDALEKEFGMLINIPVSRFSECHYHALTELIYNLNSIVLKSVVGQQFPTLSNEACNIDVQNMSAEGKGKVRYCGAWAIAKERHRCKEYFKSNIRSSDPGVRKKAKEAYAKKELLEQLIWSSGMAKEESKYQDTLNVTFSWTYEKGRLVHITDQMFEWSLELEQGRVNLLNNQSLATNKEDLVSITLARMLDNQQLKHKWKALFSQRENENCDESLCDADLIAQLYDDVITRYVKMGVGEFLRDFRRDYKLQKTEAHRKKVVEKKKKKDLISSKVTMTSIRSDSSTNLKESHIRLQAMITEQPLIFQSTVYSKDELQLLCKGYGLAFKRSESKARLSEKLTTKIQASGDVPNPAALRDATQPGSSGAVSNQEENARIITAEASVQRESTTLQVAVSQQVVNEPVASTSNIQGNITSDPLQEAVVGTEAPLQAARLSSGASHEPIRKRFKPSRNEEEILCGDQHANEAMARAYERSVQFKTTLKAIITWHEKHN